MFASIGIVRVEILDLALIQGVGPLAIDHRNMAISSRGASDIWERWRVSFIDISDGQCATCCCRIANIPFIHCGLGIAGDNGSIVYCGYSERAGSFTRVCIAIIDGIFEANIAVKIVNRNKL